MRRLIAMFFVLSLVIVLCACGSTDDFDDVTYEQRLSESCDYVLCKGVDTSGNSYELVANQTETSLGFEITVGVIKNNEWLYPLSADFPFLWEDGLFHVEAPMGRESGYDLSYYSSITEMIRFIDTGAFAMESYNTRTATGLDLYDHTMIFFSCNTLKSYVVDCEEFSLLYRSSKADRKIITENGKILLYWEITGTNSGWSEDQVFDWCLLDTQTLDIETFASGVAGVHPESILSEGLIFASDQFFYDTNGQKVIDLSDYNIDMFYDSDIYFENGTCTFKAENTLGTEFLITIDTSGNVLNEVQQ